MSTLNQRTENALDDIIAARLPGLNPTSHAAVRCMVMDLLFYEMWKRCDEEHAISADMLKAWSGELAARTQLFMDSHGMIKDKQKMLGQAAKLMAPELMTQFTQRVVAPPDGG